MKQVLVITISLILSLLTNKGSLMAADIVISDENLAGFLKSGNPNYDQIRLRTAQVFTSYLQNNDQFATGLNFATTVSESDNPLESPWAQQQTMAISKKMPWGLESSLAYVVRKEKFGSTVPVPFANQAYYVPALALNIKMDLWKNLFGAYDDAKENYLKVLFSQSKINRKLETKQFYNSLRMVYWRLVVQKRRSKILKNFVASAKTALSNMKSRQRDSVADKGAVSEMAANLSSAEANYRRAQLSTNMLERELKNLAPVLLGKKITIKGAYPTIRQAVADSLECSKTLSSIEGIPYQYTDYDELVAQIKKGLYWKSQDIDKYSAADVSLNFGAQGLGVDQDFVEAATQPFGLEKSAYSATLEISIPLGSPRRTEKFLLANEREAASIQESQINAQFKSAHDNLKMNHQALSEAVRYYHKSIKDQAQVLHFTDQKFRQGRLSVFDYIGSQNVLLNTKLQVVGVEEQVILDMINYFSLFNQAPCKFNRS